jgi:hypothetical protein
MISAFSANSPIRLLAGQAPDLVDLRDYGAGVRFRYADRANRTLVTLEASQKDGAGGH